MPGWETTSWGYHGDNGEKYHDNYWGQAYNDAEMYSTGDIVGCLYDIEKKEISFTKNGELLGKSFPSLGLFLIPSTLSSLHPPSSLPLLFLLLGTNY